MSQLNKVCAGIIIPVFVTGILFLAAQSCGHAPVASLDPDPDTALRVYFFHLSSRCEACDAVEANTLQVLDKHYKELLNDEKIRFRSFGIENRNNRDIIRKYQVSYTTLLLIRADGSYTDFSNTALNYANMNPAKFDELLKEEIDRNLE